MLFLEKGRVAPYRPSSIDSLDILIVAYMPDENPCNILQRSAGFCKVTVGWQYRGAKVSKIFFLDYFDFLFVL